jgi:hypothetical protein
LARDIGRATGPVKIAPAASKKAAEPGGLLQQVLQRNAQIDGFQTIGTSR